MDEKMKGKEEGGQEERGESIERKESSVEEESKLKKPEDNTEDTIPGDDRSGISGVMVDNVSERLKKAEEELKRRFEQLSETQRRVVFGVVIAALSSFFVISGGITFTIFVAFASFLAALEIYNLLEMKGESPYKNVGIAVSCAIPFVAYFFPPQTLFALLTFSLIAIFFLQVASKEYRGAIEKILMTFFGIMYTGWLGGAHAVMLRNIGREVGHHGFSAVETGLFVTIFVIVTTVFSDIGAYFVGKKFGRTKIAEKISPGKTLEGFIGGVLLSVLGAVLLKLVFAAEGSYLIYAGLGALASAVGLLGDIAESSLKRDVHVKDSGFIIPGHGGILDRVDSLLFTIPVFYYLFLYIIPKISP